MKYLLVTHIPFTRTADSVMVDGLWARDLRATAAALGPIRVAAPEIAPGDTLGAWGVGTEEISCSDRIEFTGLPVMRSRRDVWKTFSLRATLRRAVEAADVIHTSNYFPPYAGLAYAHDLAVRLGRKTVFVVAEDFHDMLEWEWVRTAPNGFVLWRRSQTLAALDRRLRKSARSATLTFLHTPAAVERYRLCAKEGMAIRQPAHEREHVISERELAGRLGDTPSSRPLVIAAACRHSALKGVDYLIRAVKVLAERGIFVHARIFGAGPMTGEWTRLAERLAVSDRVAFPGSLAAGEAVYRELRNADLFAMPHRTTDFGRAFFDALAAGLPVLAFRTPASEATVRDQVDGLLSPMDDFESLAHSLERFHSDRELLARCSWRARERAVRNTASAWHRIRAARIAEILPDGEPGLAAIGPRQPEAEGPGRGPRALRLDTNEQ